MRRILNYFKGELFAAAVVGMNLAQSIFLMAGVSDPVHPFWSGIHHLMIAGLMWLVVSYKKEMKRYEALLVISRPDR